MGLFSSIGKIAGVVGAATGNPWLTAGSSILGGMDANDQARQSAENQMSFQQFNSNSAYQRAMADMKLAGLNPMLAYTQGGASTPQGASYTPTDVVTPAMSSARQAADTKSTISQRTVQNQNLQSQTQLNQSNSLTAQTQAQLNSALQTKAAADTQAAMASADSAHANAANTKVDTLLKMDSVPGAKNKADMDRTSFGKTIPYIKPITEGANSAGSLIRSFSPSKSIRDINVRHHDY